MRAHILADLWDLHSFMDPFPLNSQRRRKGAQAVKRVRILVMRTVGV